MGLFENPYALEGKELHALVMQEADRNTSCGRPENPWYC